MGFTGRLENESDLHPDIEFNERVVDKKSEPKKESSNTTTTSPESLRVTDFETRISSWSLVQEGESNRHTPLFERFLEMGAPAAALGATSMGILQAFANIDVTAERMALLISGNPFFEDLFQRVVASAGKREQVPSVEAAITLMGIQNSRNLIVANQILRTVRGSFPEWTKEGKLKVLSSEIVKNGLKAEEALVAKKDPLSDLGFVAGVLFDIASQLSAEHAEDKKKTQALLDATFDHGLKTATYAAALARGLPGFPFSKYVFSAGLLHDIGKPLLAVLDKRYLGFLEEMAKKDLPRSLRHHLEKSRFGVDHAFLGASWVRSYPPLRLIASAIQLHHGPLQGRKGGGEEDQSTTQGLRQLGAILSLASNMTSKPKKLENPTDPIIALWRGAELRDFEFPNEILVEASQLAT